MESFKALPWNERKQLIELLEDIKQTEYVKKPAVSDAAEATSNATVRVANHDGGMTPDLNPNVPDNKLADKQSDSGFDPSVKKSEQDVDDLMQRLIIQEKQHHQPIPDKSSVMKLLLGVFVVILLLAVLF